MVITVSFEYVVNNDDGSVEVCYRGMVSNIRVPGLDADRIEMEVRENLPVLSVARRIPRHSEFVILNIFEED